MKCEHKNVNEVPTPESIHHGKAVCADCGAFLRWLKKPETIAREIEDARKRTVLWTVENLPAWERTFLMEFEKSGKLSPKQRVIFDKIWATYGH